MWCNISVLMVNFWLAEKTHYFNEDPYAIYKSIAGSTPQGQYGSNRAVHVVWWGGVSPMNASALWIWQHRVTLNPVTHRGHKLHHMQVM